MQGGLEFIASEQTSDGGFWEYTLAGSSGAAKYKTTYLPSVVALALAEVAGAGEVCRRATQFVGRQKSDDWTWNYWPRASVYRKKQPYPDDLDDTFLALSAVWRDDPGVIRPADMAKIAQVLFAAELQPGGPYRTWLVDETAAEVWRDIDPVVNSNIGGFLALQKVEVPGIMRLIEDTVASGDMTSPYYVSQWPFLYFTSRWYTGAAAELMKKHVLGLRVQGVWETPQTTALAITILLRLGYSVGELAPAATLLRDTQRPDGGWEAEPFSIGPTGQASGGRALTTALCVEALARYDTKKAGPHAPAKRRKADGEVYERMVSTEVSHIEGAELQAGVKRLFERIQKRDSDGQIAKMPQLVAHALGLELDTALASSLGEASVWGWMAYTSFDDYMDGEGADLPAALYAHRKMLAAFARSLPADREFHAYIEHALTKIDQANIWELAQCRWQVRRGGVVQIGQVPEYGNYWQLADRSLGHMLAGVGVLCGAGYVSRSREQQAFERFFRAYLVARQLNDDAHDWLDDLAGGHINAVCTKIILEWQRTSPGRKTIRLARETEALQLIMWERVIDVVCGEINEHITQARQALSELGAGEESVLEGLLLPLETSANQALTKRDEALEFMTTL